MPRWRMEIVRWQVLRLDLSSVMFYRRPISGWLDRGRRPPPCACVYPFQSPLLLCDSLSQLSPGFDAAFPLLPFFFAFPPAIFPVEGGFT